MAAINPEELIEAVRTYPALYDQTEEQYRNSDYRDIVWKEVARILNVEGQEEDCKRKWNGIRDSLRRALQKRKTKSGRAATSTKYRYETILEFLIPHLDKRKGLGNVKDEETDDDAPETSNESKQHNSAQESQQPQDVSNEDESDEATDFLQSPLTSTPTNRVSTDRRHSYAGRERKLLKTEVKFQESASSQSLSYILDENKAHSTTRSQSSEQHPVDAFLAVIAISLKSLDPVRLLAAKGKIFNVVQEYELRQIRANRQQKTTRAAMYPSASSAKTSRVSTPALITSEEEGSFADEYGPPHFSNYVAPTPKVSNMTTDEDTNLSYSNV